MTRGPSPTFVLVDRASGPDVTPAWLASCAAAIDHALTHAFAEAWGLHAMCRAGTPVGHEVPVILEPSSTDPGAAGYHTDESAYCFRDGLPSLDSGPESFSCVIAHEIFETLLDPGANRWALSPSGTLYALEACDAVEGLGFASPLNGVWISDFVLPAFFDADAPGPWSRLRNAPEAFTTASDGGASYQITLSPGGDGEAQVTASRRSPEGPAVFTYAGATVISKAYGRVARLAAHGVRASAKAHPASRTARRLAPLARFV